MKHDQLNQSAGIATKYLLWMCLNRILPFTSKIHVQNLRDSLAETKLDTVVKVRYCLQLAPFIFNTATKVTISKLLCKTSES
jgi:hypothetical protein